MENLAISMNVIKRQRWFVTGIGGVVFCFCVFWFSLVWLSGPCQACTSFATYATKPIYGMNFDYPAHLELRFAITEHNGIKVFRQQFVQGSMIADIAGMNSHGLLSTQQIVNPIPANITGQSSNPLYLWDLHNGVLTQFANISQVRDWLSTRTLIHYPDIPLHSLLADITGQAIVAEVGEQGNAITPIEGDFHVMTNFPVYQFAGKSYEEVEGSGSTRYKIAYQYLLEQAEHFDIEYGLALLQVAINTSAEYPTRCSMVFDPTTQEIYVALEGNFEKIWKVSLQDGTMETWKGFTEPVTVPLTTQGILASSLEHHR
jgi:hypothetical protein